VNNDARVTDLHDPARFGDTDEFAKACDQYLSSPSAGVLFLSCLGL